MTPPEAATRPWLALQATLAVQMLASVALSAAPVLAPAVAPQLGIAPERVGLFMGLAYLCAMLSGLATGRWSARIGPTRVSQALLLLLAAGAAMATIEPVWGLLAAAGLIGMGYGAANPAAAAILGRHAPAGASGLFFALKQAGVPLGVAVCGVLMPLGLASLGWRASAWGVAAACGLLAVLLLPAAPRLDPRDRANAAPVGAWSALRDAMRLAPLRRLSLVSLAYAATQQGFLTFVVALLHLEHGWPLATAAGLLAASQLVCTGVRIGMGHVADRWIAPRRLLGLLGIAMSLACVALAALPRDAALPWVAAVVLATGAAAMGWNGVFFAELVRSVPRERLAAAAGGTQFFTFGGGMLGPVVFGAIVQSGGSYALGYASFALLGAGGAAAMLLRSPSPCASAQPLP